jgi:hypothetical protein
VKRRKDWKEKTQALAAGVPKNKVGRPTKKTRARATILNTNNRQKHRVEQKTTNVLFDALDALTAIVSTRSGKKAFPTLQPKLAKQAALAQTGQGAIVLARTVGEAQKRFHVRFLVSNVTDLEILAEISGFPLKYLQKQKAESNLTKDLPPDAMFANRRPYPGSSPSSSHDFLESICKKFFVAHSGIFSGARSGTRQLGLKHHELMFRLYAEYPGHCRDAAALWPAQVREIRTKQLNNLSRSKLTATESSILNSIDAAEVPMFDEVNEFKSRYNHAKQQYRRKLCETRLSKKYTISTTQARAFIKKPQDAKSRQDTTDGITDAFILAQALLELDPPVQSKPPSSEDMIAQADTNMRSQMQTEDLLQNLQLTDRDKVDFELPDDSGLPSPSRLFIKPPRMETFWKIISGAGIKWSTNIHPHECPLHDTGPQLKGLIAAAEQIEAANDAKLATAKEAIYEYLSTKDGTDSLASDLVNLRSVESKCLDNISHAKTELRKYRDLHTRYERHLQQYEVCRPLLTLLESKVGPGEAIMYRDFVNQYMGSGAKLANLVLVVLWRTRKGMPCKVVKFNNFCDDPLSRACDPYFVADVMQLYFGSQEHACVFFRREQISVVFLAGDHGSHFSAIKTVYNESCFFSRYGIILICLFLCSYHAFNRCDAAGEESVRLMLRRINARGEHNTSGGYSAMLNNSHSQNSFGVELPEICRNCEDDPVFPVPLVKNENLDLRGKCQIRFSWFDDGKECRENGVILCRDIPAMPRMDPKTSLHTLPGEGALFEVYDLRSLPPDKVLCRLCSKIAQKPVRHGDQACPTLSTQLQEYEELANDLKDSYGVGSNRIKATKKALN